VGRLAHALPLRRSEATSRCESRRRRRSRHLPWSSLRFRVLYVTRYRTAWVIRSRRDVVVSDPPARCSLGRRPPHACACGFILSCASRLLQSLSSRTRPERMWPHASKHLPWGSAPLRDVSWRRPLMQASPACFVPSTTFHTSSTACSATSLAGLFHPAATYGIHSPGVFPLARWYGLVVRPPPHGVQHPPPVAGLPAKTRRRQKHVPAYRVSFRAGVRTTSRRGLAHAPPAPLLSFPSFGFCFTNRDHLGLAALVLSAHDVTCVRPRRIDDW